MPHPCSTLIQNVCRSQKFIDIILTTFFIMLRFQLSWSKSITICRLPIMPTEVLSRSRWFRHHVERTKDQPTNWLLCVYYYYKCFWFQTTTSSCWIRCHFGCCKTSKASVMNCQHYWIRTTLMNFGKSTMTNIVKVRQIRSRWATWVATSRTWLIIDTIVGQVSQPAVSVVLIRVREKVLKEVGGNEYHPPSHTSTCWCFMTC